MVIGQNDDVRGFRTELQGLVESNNYLKVLGS